MNEERFDKTGADPMTLLITERLAERKRKLNRMAEMERKIEKSLKAMRLNIYIISSAAAIALAAIIVWPIYRSQMSPLDRLDIAAPTMTEYRAAKAEMTEIALLVKEEDYEKAMLKTHNALVKSDYALKEIAGTGFECNDEEILYEEELEKSENSELRWTYIYILVRLDKDKEARKQLKIYLKDKKYSEHRNEALALLKEI